MRKLKLIYHLIGTPGILGCETVENKTSKSGLLNSPAADIFRKGKQINKLKTQLSSTSFNSSKLEPTAYQEVAGLHIGKNDMIVKNTYLVGM